MDEADGDGPLMAEISTQTKDSDVLDCGEFTREIRGASFLTRGVVHEKNLYAIWLGCERLIKLTEER
jgi:hypothetical protein